MASYQKIANLKGPRGPVGPAPELVEGTTDQVAAGEPAKLTLTEVGPGQYRIDGQVPKGLDGDPSGVADLDNSTASNINTQGTATQAALNAQIVDQIANDDTVVVAAAAALADSPDLEDAAEQAATSALAGLDLLEEPQNATSIGKTSMDGVSLVVDVSTVWGIDSTGSPYYDDAGASPGEDAVLSLESGDFTWTTLPTASIA